jgi:hypothetical protein
MQTPLYPTIPMVDKLSIVPVIQQVIGVGTILYHTAKAVQALFGLAHCHNKLDLKNNEVNRTIKQTIINNWNDFRSKSLRVDGKRDLEDFQEKLQQEVEGKKTITHGERIATRGLIDEYLLAFPEAYKYLQRQALYRLYLKNHIHGIGVGILRTLPVVGTIYSSIVCYKATCIQSI